MYEQARAEDFAPNAKLDESLKFALDNKIPPRSVLKTIKEHFPNEQLPEDLRAAEEIVRESDEQRNRIVGYCSACGKGLSAFEVMPDPKGLQFCFECWRRQRDSERTKWHAEQRQHRQQMEEIYDLGRSIGEKFRPCSSCGKLIMKREAENDYAQSGYCLLCYQDIEQNARDLFEQAVSENFSSTERLGSIVELLSQNNVQLSSFFPTIRTSILSWLDAKAGNETLEHRIQERNEGRNLEDWKLEVSIELIERAIDPVNAIKTFLNLNPRFCLEIDQEINYLRSVLQAGKGKLPACSPSIIVPAGEVMHCEVPAAFTEPVTSDQTDGRMFITNQRVLFLSDLNRFEFPHHKIVNVTDYGEAFVSIELSGGYGSGDYATSKNELIAQILLWLAKTANRQVLDSPSGASRSIPQQIKIEVWQRDQGRCVQCGAQEYLEYDHVIPFSMGGATSAVNLQLLCRKCNLSKRARL